jgi:hypothetical protein
MSLYPKYARQVATPHGEEQQQQQSIPLFRQVQKKQVSLTEAVQQVMKIFNFLKFPQPMFNQRFFSNVLSANDQAKLKFLSKSGFVYDPSTKLLTYPQPQGSVGKNPHPWREKAVQRHGRMLTQFFLYKDCLDLEKDCFATFLKDSIPEFDKVLTEFRHFLMYHYSYGWEFYYDVGPWTVVTLEGLTDVDRKKCKDHILNKLFHHLHKLYNAVDRIPQDELHQDMKTILILYILWNTIPHSKQLQAARKKDEKDFPTLSSQQIKKLAFQDKSDGECIQLFLAMLRQFDLCKDLMKQFVMLQGLQHVTMKLLESRGDEFLRDYQNWMVERYQHRKSYLDFNVDLFFNLNIRMRKAPAVQRLDDIQLLRMTDETILKMWQRFMYHLEPSSSELSPVQRFLEEIYATFYEAIDIMKDDKDRPHYSHVIHLFTGRLNQLASFFEHHEELFVPFQKQPQRRTESSPVMLETLNPLFAGFSEFIPTYTKFFETLKNHFISSPPPLKSITDLHWIFSIFFLRTVASDPEFYKELQSLFYDGNLENTMMRKILPS